MADMTDEEFECEWQRGEIAEARAQRDDAVAALREIYLIAGEDQQIVAIANRVLAAGWAAE